MWVIVTEAHMPNFTAVRKGVLEIFHFLWLQFSIDFVQGLFLALCQIDQNGENVGKTCFLFLFFTNVVDILKHWIFFQMFKKNLSPKNNFHSIGMLNRKIKETLGMLVLVNFCLIFYRNSEKPHL